MSTARHIPLLGLLATLTAPAAGQALEPIDQTIEDITLLAGSLREIEPGLGHPNDFRQVYRYQDDQLMRAQRKADQESAALARLEADRLGAVSRNAAE